MCPSTLRPLPLITTAGISAFYAKGVFLVFAAGKHGI
jgi:hypothetical protein